MLSNFQLDPWNPSEKILKDQSEVPEYISQKSNVENL